MDDTILEEHAVVERHGFLGGKKISTSSEGQIHRFTYIPACDFCGQHPLTEYFVCQSCKGKLCSKCGIEFCGRKYCRACLIELLPISKNTFKVMLCVAYGIESVSKISKLTRVRRQDVKVCMALLSEMKLIQTNGLSVFSRQELTANGAEAITVFSRVYGTDGDVTELEAVLSEEREEEQEVGV